MEPVARVEVPHPGQRAYRVLAPARRPRSTADGRQELISRAGTRDWQAGPSRRER